MHICSFHDASGQIEVDGKIWRFDFSRMFGPLWLNQNGSEKKNQNPPSKVWDAFYAQWFVPKYGEPVWMREEREFQEDISAGRLVKVGRHYFPPEMIDAKRQPGVRD